LFGVKGLELDNVEAQSVLEAIDKHVKQLVLVVIDNLLNRINVVHLIEVNLIVGFEVAVDHVFLGPNYCNGLLVIHLEELRLLFEWVLQLAKASQVFCDEVKLEELVFLGKDKAVWFSIGFISSEEELHRDVIELFFFSDPHFLNKLEDLDACVWIVATFVDENLVWFLLVSDEILA